jgi:hypothetical protein
LAALNRHSRSLGNDPNTAAARTSGASGCFAPTGDNAAVADAPFPFSGGRFAAPHLEGFAGVAWLVKVLAGLSLKAAAEKLRLPFALETIYRLRRRLRHGWIRCGHGSAAGTTPPASAHSDPLLQTVEHLQTVFAGSQCPPADFQLRFQHAVFGLKAPGLRTPFWPNYRRRFFPTGSRWRQHDNPIPVPSAASLASPA